jgi:hypothetical protein
MRQAADIYRKSGDRAKEGIAHSNRAQNLVKLGRHNEARQELDSAIACKRDYSHTVEPWHTWATLEDLERATGHPEAGRAARQQAIATYLAYRRDGGSSHSGVIWVYAAAAQAIKQNQQDELARRLNELLGPDTPPSNAAAARAVLAILAGERDPAVADHPDIDPINAAELLLLLETL